MGRVEPINCATFRSSLINVLFKVAGPPGCRHFQVRAGPRVAGPQRGQRNRRRELAPGRAQTHRAGRRHPQARPGAQPRPVAGPPGGARDGPPPGPGPAPGHPRGPHAQQGHLDAPPPRPAPLPPRLQGVPQNRPPLLPPALHKGKGQRLPQQAQPHGVHPPRQEREAQGEAARRATRSQAQEGGPPKRKGAQKGAAQEGIRPRKRAENHKHVQRLQEPQSQVRKE